MSAVVESVEVGARGGVLVAAHVQGQISRVGARSTFWRYSVSQHGGSVFRGVQ